MILLQWLGYIILGAGVLVAGVVALCIVIAKAAGHDQATCDCWDCQARRGRAVDKAVAKRDKKAGGHTPPPIGEDPPTELRSSFDYWTTLELRTGYHVFIRKTMYEIGIMRTMPNGNCLVHLRNMDNRREVQPIMITPQMKNVRLWRKGADPRLYG